jgi:acylphosphatase
METQRLRVIARGRVQGVGFRWFVRDLGEALGLCGWVRNLPDGRSVEAVGQGDAVDVEEFRRRLQSGPPGAHVSELEAHAEPVEEGLAGFQILH